MDNQIYNLRQATTVVGYAQANELLQKYENQITKHTNGVQILSVIQIREMLVELCRIQLKCPTLKRVILYQYIYTVLFQHPSSNHFAGM